MSLCYYISCVYVRGKLNPQVMLKIREPVNESAHYDYNDNSGYDFHSCDYCNY